MRRLEFFCADCAQPVWFDMSDDQPLPSAVRCQNCTWDCTAKMYDVLNVSHMKVPE
jgi:hypothetical protein